MYSENLQHSHLCQLLEVLKGISDPAERVTAIDRALGLTTTAQSALAELRREAIRAMLTTMTKSDVARHLGVTRGRVTQLVGKEAS